MKAAVWSMQELPAQAAADRDGYRSKCRVISLVDLSSISDFLILLALLYMILL